MGLLAVAPIDRSYNSVTARYRRSSPPLANHPKGPGPTRAGMRHAFALKGVVSFGLVRADSPEGAGNVHVSRGRGDAERLRKAQDTIALA
jgi:hypothetical protein